VIAERRFAAFGSDQLGSRAALAIVGRCEEAADMEKKNRRRLRVGRSHFSYAACHFGFLACRGEDSAALRLWEKFLPHAFDSNVPGRRFEFHGAAAGMFGRLRERKASLKLRLPSTFPLTRPDGVYKTGDLYDWFHTQATDIAAQFDARNGHDCETRISLPELTYADVPSAC
jgi:hypothetical protein